MSYPGFIEIGSFAAEGRKRPAYFHIIVQTGSGCFPMEEGNLPAKPPAGPARRAWDKIKPTFNAEGGPGYRNWRNGRRVATWTSTLTARNAWISRTGTKSNQLLTHESDLRIEIEQTAAEWRPQHEL